MRKAICGALLVATAALAGAKGAEAAMPGPRVFPGGRLFAPLVADPADPKLAAQYMGATKGSLVGYEFHIGMTAPLLQWDLIEAAEATGAENQALQVGADADAQLFIDDGAHFQMQVSDFHVGLPLDYRRGDFTGRLRIGHTSSHMGDDFLRRHSGFPQRRFNREFVALLPSYTMRNLRLYAGAAYIVHSDPRLHREMAQWGAEIEGPMLWAERLGTYAAADFQARAENDYAIKTNVQAGIVLRAEPDHRLRLGFRFFDGPSSLGQFFKERQQWLGVGLYYAPTIGPRPGIRD